MNKTEILQKFREYLTGNGFGPGDKLPGEMELAEQFGISRGDIREVLMHFSHLGLLSRVKKRGTFICEVPYANLQNDMTLCPTPICWKPGSHWNFLLRPCSSNGSTGNPRKNCRTSSTK